MGNGRLTAAQKALLRTHIPLNIDMSAEKFPPHLVLTGPTASGKTAAALALAGCFRVEIISVDSALVYTGMDIGTAKPNRTELAAAPHHLIDIRDPSTPYSAAEFARDAAQLMHDITGRGALPLLVGGTMLYLKALFEGLDDMPPADPAVRKAIAADALALGWPALHTALAQVDAITAARLAPLDSQRIARALEVFRISGQPLSSFQKRNAPDVIANEAQNTWAARVISLEPADRSWLHDRIARRFDTMLASGFLDEVLALRARRDLHPELPSMRCVGYRQAWDALDGKFPMAELRDKGVFATRQLAKRQITWLHSLPGRQVVACDDPTALQQVLALADAALHKP